MVFKDKYFFLSTFSPCELQLNIKGEKFVYNNVESAFQAMKNLDLAPKFLLLSGLEAKKLGADIPITTENGEIKQLYIMADLLHQKFDNFSLLLQLRLLKEDIVNDNYWKDTFGGVYKGEGKNILGKMLTVIRDTKNNYDELIKLVDREALALCTKAD